MTEREIVIDLFGQPVALPSAGGCGRRGRPAHRWSLENENRVKMGLAMDWTQERIAAGLGISVPTLKAYYSSTLKLRDMARAQFDLNRMMRLQEQANGGNVGAAKELRAMFDRIDRDRLDREARGAPKQQKQIGKKAARLAAAEAIADDENDQLFAPLGSSGPH